MYNNNLVTIYGYIQLCFEMSSTIFVLYNIEGSVYFIEIELIYTIIHWTYYTNYIIY